MISSSIPTKNTYTMDDKVCPKTANCPIFSGILKGTDFTEVYKKQYCEAGLTARQRCRRFQVAAVAGKCPPNVLPNSSKTVEEIVEEMKKAGMA